MFPSRHMPPGIHTGIRGGETSCIRSHNAIAMRTTIGLKEEHSGYTSRDATNLTAPLSRTSVFQSADYVPHPFQDIIWNATLGHLVGEVFNGLDQVSQLQAT